jgi:3-mercaptopyruvate sulfurtransferase SseA
MQAAELIDRDKTVVVYCWGPGCNGAQKAAVEFAWLGYTVQEMLGGFEYWAREGWPVETGIGAITRRSADRADRSRLRHLLRLLSGRNRAATVSRTPSYDRNDCSARPPQSC